MAEEFLLCALEFGSPACGDHHIRSGLEHRLRDAESDALARAGDQGPQTLLTRDDADTDRISQRLRYPVTGRNHLGVVAWREAGTDAADDLAEAAAAWLRAAGAAEVLVLNRAESAVWAW